MTRERDDQLGDIVKLREQMAESQGKQSQMEQDMDEAQSKIQEVHFLFIIQLQN